MYAAKQQIIAIKTLKSKLGMTDEDYYAMLHGFRGVESCKKLYAVEASELIIKLSAIAPPQKAKPALQPGQALYYGKGARGQQKHLTQEQAERIAILKELLGWNDARVYGFIKRQTGGDKAIQMLMNYQASKVIVGMQKILCAGKGLDYRDINNCTNVNLKQLLNRAKE